MKKLLSILLVIMLIITFIQIRDMYALYKEDLSGEYSTSLGKWNVKINGINIASPGQVVEFDITDKNMGYIDGDFKSTGAQVIAPNTEAFFDLLFDTTNTQVAVKYVVEVGKVDSYKIIENSTGLPIVDTTDDETDDATDDYAYSLKYPITFEVQEITDLFGNYTISTEDGNEGLIEGNESTETFTQKNKVDKDSNSAKGVIPLDVSQKGYQNKVRIEFKWLMDEDTILEENKEDYEKMYESLVAQNNAEQTVKLLVPLKVKAIQYFGEEL